MSEPRDVYTIDDKTAGRVWLQGAARRRGDYCHHAVLILRTPDGRYPLAQRALDSDYFPGEWDVTGGGVRAGETELAAGIREAAEELGVSVFPENCIFLHKYRLDYENGTGSHVYVYGAVFEHEGGYAFDPGEVNAVRDVRFDEFISAVMYNKDTAFGEALRAFEAKFSRETR